jgi:hypothetical protein
MMTFNPSRRAATRNDSTACTSGRQCVTSELTSTRPLDTSSIARGYVCFMRRTSLIASPFRRAREAEKQVLSSSRIPTRTTLPLGKTAAKASSTAERIPATSSAISTLACLSRKSQQTRVPARVAHLCAHLQCTHLSHCMNKRLAYPYITTQMHVYTHFSKHGCLGSQNIIGCFS